MKHILLKIVAGISTIALLSSSTVTLASCSQNQSFLRIIGEKDKKFNSNYLSLFKLKLAAPLDGGKLYVEVVQKNRIDDMTLSYYGCSSPSGNDLVSNILLKVKPVKDYAIQQDDKISFDLIVSNMKDQKVVWESMLTDLSVSYDATIPLVDSNYNGWTDDIDPYDDDHTYTGTMYSVNQCPIDFRMNYETLINADPTVYNPELAKLAALLSVSVGDKLALSIKDEMFTDVNKLLRQIGCLNYATYDLEKEEYLTDIYDTDVYSVGHHDVLYKDGQTYRIIFLSFRGSVTETEIASDFDVGDVSDDYFKFKEGPDGSILDHPDWIKQMDDPDGKHAKSFAVVKNRVIDHLMGEDGYFAKHNIDLKQGNNILFINGHSRGASIANLLAAHFIQHTEYTGIKKLFAYCLATPRVTQDANYNDPKYNCIQCVRCHDDIVPNLPLTDWGFHVYGQEKTFKISDVCEEEYSKKVSTIDGTSLPYICFYHSPNIFTKDTIAYKTRADLYTFDETHDYLTVKYEDMESESDINSFIERYKIQDCVKVTHGKTAAGADCLYITSIGGAIIKILEMFLSGQLPEGMSLDDLDIAQIIFENSLPAVELILTDIVAALAKHTEQYSIITAPFYMFTFTHLLPGYYFAIDHFKQ